MATPSRIRIGVPEASLLDFRFAMRPLRFEGKLFGVRLLSRPALFRVNYSGIDPGLGRFGRQFIKIYQFHRPAAGCMKNCTCPVVAATGCPRPVPWTGWPRSNTVRLSRRTESHVHEPQPSESLMPSVSISGTDLNYVDEGRGPVLLLVHGFPHRPHDVAVSDCRPLERRCGSSR